MQQGRVGRIAVKARPAHGVEVGLIVSVAGKAREVKPSEVRLKPEDERATQLSAAEQNEVTAQADAWITTHHVEAAGKRQKQREIAALDVASRLRPVYVYPASADKPAEKEKDKEKEREEKDKEREGSRARQRARQREWEGQEEEKEEEKIQPHAKRQRERRQEEAQGQRQRQTQTQA